MVQTEWIYKTKVYFRQIQMIVNINIPFLNKQLVHQSYSCMSNLTSNRWPSEVEAGAGDGVVGVEDHIDPDKVEELEKKKQ